MWSAFAKAGAWQIENYDPCSLLRGGRAQRRFRRLMFYERSQKPGGEVVSKAVDLVKKRIESQSFTILIHRGVK